MGEECHRAGESGKSASESIGAAIREQFNGKLLEQTLQNVLPKLAETQHVKRNKQEKIDDKRHAEEHFKELERKLAQKSWMYVCRYIEARFENATDLFTSPFMKFLRSVTLAVCSLLVGAVFRFLKMDRFIVNRLHEIIQYGSEKVVEVFSQQDLHEDMVFHGVEAFEDVLYSFDGK